MKDRKAKNLIVIFFTLAVSPFTIGADEAVQLQFIHTEGEVLHADSLVDETVYINGYLSHQAEIDEFSVSVVRDVDSENNALLDSSFRTVERIGHLPGFHEWISSETVHLKRNSTGEMIVPNDAARPVLRNVPRFPDHPVKPGDSWSLPGEEVHILRINNNLYGPYRSEVQVLYRYLDNIVIENRTCARISLEYSIYLPVRERGEPVRLISGKSVQELLWDIHMGRPESKNEDFEFMMMMRDGVTQEFVGSGKTTYRFTQSFDRPVAVESLISELQSVPGITVKPTEEGILLSVIETDNILFEPELSIVSDDQRYRLEQLRRSLLQYSERDILITGHTADYGTEEGRKALSRDRAAAVADLLFPQGRSGRGQLFLRGAGNSEPLGSDKENRRVEILILD